MDAIILGIDHDHGRRGVVLHREIEDLGAGLARCHRADAEVVAAAPAARSDHVPGGRFEAQLDAEFFRDGLGHIHVKAVELVLIIEEREGRVALHQYVDHFLARHDAVQGRAGNGL
ncbi:hypothetical protein D3C80_1803700 [compost metagenome]